MLSSSSLRRSLTVLRNDIATAPIRIRPLLTHTTTIPSTSQCSPSRLRPFSSLSCLQKHHNLPPRPKPPPDSEIEESFLKGSGPGGQKINKTNSAVQLKHVPTGIVVKCQATRSRSQNRTIARELLAARVDDLARGDESRSAVVGAFHRKRKASKAKKSRRKYRKLLAAEGEEGGEKRREGEDGLEEVDEWVDEEEVEGSGSEGRNKRERGGNGEEVVVERQDNELGRSSNKTTPADRDRS